MEPIVAPPSNNNPFHPEPPGRYIIFVWSTLVTVILFAYIGLSVVLYLEGRNYARRHQQLIDAWRNTPHPWLPPSPPPSRHEQWLQEQQQQHQQEQSPLMRFEDEEQEESRDRTQGWYGSTDSHPSFGPADNNDEDHQDVNVDGVANSGSSSSPPPPPFSPGSPSHSYLRPIETLVEPPESDEEGTHTTRPRLPPLSIWAANPDDIGNSSSGKAAAAAAALDNSPADLRPSPRPEEASSSSARSPQELDGRELVTKIKKAVHWHSGLKGGSSSSSRSSSSSSSYKKQKSLEGLRKRSSQE